MDGSTGKPLKGVPLLDADGNVDLLVCIDGKMRIPELCGSFSLPRIVGCLHYELAQSAQESTKVRITIEHIGKVRCSCGALCVLLVGF